MWGLLAYISELAPAVLVTGCVVLRPIPLQGELLRLPEIVGEVVEPFLDPFLVAEGEAPCRSAEVFRDLDGVDDDALDCGRGNDLGSQGVEGHLVVRVELIEVELARYGCGRLMIHDKEVVIVFDDLVQVATEDVGLHLRQPLRMWDLCSAAPLLGGWSPIQRKPKAKLDRWLTVW